ncbi:hypothetical protein [Ferruginibacter sp.]
MSNNLKIRLLFFSGCLFFICSCTKEYSCEKCLQISTQVDTTLTDTTFFTDCIIDGVRYFNISGREGCAATYESAGNATTKFYLSGVGGKNIAGTGTDRNSLYFYKGVQAIDSNLPLKQQIIAYFVPGQYPYTKIYSLTEGIVLIWTDSNGKKWQTDLGTGNQSGSSFIITKEDFSFLNGIVNGIYVKATFTCILYDGLGNSKTLTNGRFCLPVWA